MVAMQRVSPPMVILYVDGFVCLLVYSFLSYKQQTKAKRWVVIVR